MLASYKIQNQFKKHAQKVSIHMCVFTQRTALYLCSTKNPAGDQCKNKTIS